jgi:hypothetical protein
MPHAFGVMDLQMGGPGQINPCSKMHPCFPSKICTMRNPKSYIFLSFIEIVTP